MKRIFTLLFFVVMWCSARAQDNGMYEIQISFELQDNGAVITTPIAVIVSICFSRSTIRMTGRCIGHKI